LTNNFGRAVAVVGSVSALTFGLAGCGGGEEETGGPAPATGPTGATAATGEATVVAVEYDFQLPGAFQPGMTEFVLENQGEEPHELALMRLEEGRTLEDVEALIEEGVPEEPPPWITPVGGTFARPGRASDPFQANLEQGTYLVACFVTDEDGVPHAALGMLETIEVEA
jgi:hypothetical protein